MRAGRVSSLPLKLEDKKEIVAQVNDVASAALSAVIADYRGMSVEEMTELRAKARESQVYVRIVRNTLARKAVVGTEFECLSDSFVGPTLFAMSLESPGAAAKLLKEYAKEFEALEVKALALGGQVLDPSQIGAVASLPTRDEALATLMRTMQAPVTKLAQTMQAVPGKLVRTVVAVKDQKEAA